MTATSSANAPAPLRVTLVSVSLCVAAYLYVSPYYPGINNPNENVRLYMTAALVEEGRYEIDSLRKRWGWVNDAAVFNGHVYSVKAPGTSLLGVPAYALARWLRPGDRNFALYLCRLCASVAPTLLFLWFYHRFLSRVTRHVVLREAAYFSVSLGSLLYGYGLIFVSHTVSAACAFGAFILLTSHAETREAESPRRGTPFVTGVLTAAVTLFEYPGVIFSLALTGVAVVRMRHRLGALLGFVAGAALPTAAMMHFQNSAFGSPFSPGHLHVESAGFRAAHQQGLYGAVGISGEALYGLLLDVTAGLLPLTPIVLFALAGAYRACRRPRQPAAIAAMAGCLGTTLVIAAMNNWRGGWTIGPRYLAGLLPFLGYFALLGLDGIAQRQPRAAATMAIACTVPALALSGVIGAYYPHLPRDLLRPLSTLMPVLIGGGFAPVNALNLAGVYGTMSMVPLALLFVAVLGRCIAAAPRGTGGLGLVLGVSLTVALCQPQKPADTPSARAVAFIVRHWHPSRPDATAQPQGHAPRP